MNSSLTKSQIRRADVKVWFACNNHCTFCVQWDKRLHYKQRTLNEIQEILDTEYKNWCRGVVFTGGEPTVHKDLVEAVSYAHTIGYREIQIQSNGQNFSNLEYCIRLIKAGVTEFSPSIHGFYPETHDSQVMTPGGWEKVIQGLKNLKALNQRIIINSVITEQNYREAPALATLLSRLWVQQFQFAFVHILGTAKKNKDTLVPKKSDVMPYIKKALDIGRANGIACMTEAIPFCLMKGYEWAIAEYNYMPETTVVDAEHRTESYADYRWNQGKTKRDECKKCLRYSVCEWPWKEYPEIYWWEEFQPILTN